MRIPEKTELRESLHHGLATKYEEALDKEGLISKSGLYVYLSIYAKHSML